MVQKYPFSALFSEGFSERAEVTVWSNSSLGANGKAWSHGIGFAEGLISILVKTETAANGAKTGERWNFPI